ncbi:MAG: ATP-binding protein [Bacteroidetes bacterium]|nr:ATP-binding protein [Bacteroidota bacterium]MBU1719521.1 ATP-binding protein [Bacteroidota bacterium]
MDKEQLKKVIVSQREKFRDIEFVYRDELNDSKSWLDSPFVLIFSGIRRCGKSTLLTRIMEQCKDRKYYINFDDNRLINFTSDDFENLYESFIELFGEERNFYFDEIQNIDGWEHFVRRIHNEGGKVFITGSNANLLSKELGTHLTGRYVNIELFPFSFIEYLRFRKIDIQPNDLYSTRKRTIIKNAFDEYLVKGGLPEFLQTGDTNYLSTLYDNIIYRDIVSRYNVRQERSLKELLHFLVSNIAKEHSYNSLSKLVGLSNSNTVKEYISFAENSYLLFSVNKFDYSLKKQISNAKKIYFIDNGLANAVSFRFSENYGQQLENLVFLQLRREGKSVFYHRGKHECDFIIQDKGKINLAVQVSQSLDSNSTRDREMRGLLEAMDTYNLNESLILTHDEEDTIKIGDKTINVIPVWNWLLGTE